MERLITRLREELSLAKLIGSAPSFVKVLQALPAIARSDATLLIMGETGTGKELVARAIHYLSHRAAFPFVAINCGSLPDSLLEEELFGHERGAFTDAHKHRPGLIAQAEKGTLFLDEIDALGVKAQVCLLRLLQEKTYRAIGSSAEAKADVRIITATNAVLKDLIARGDLRADLYYRICVLCVQMPSLRERPEDIRALSEHFVRKHSGVGSGPATLTRLAHERLLRHDWPGNVRELENVIVRALNACESTLIDLDNLGLDPDIPAPQTDAETAPLAGFKQMKKRAVDNFEKHYLERLMSDYHGNVSQAAKFAGKERRDLGKLLKKHRLDPKTFASCSV